MHKRVKPNISLIYIYIYIEREREREREMLNNILLYIPSPSLLQIHHWICRTLWVGRFYKSNGGLANQLYRDVQRIFSGIIPIIFLFLFFEINKKKMMCKKLRVFDKLFLVFFF
jgi:hypothetical protein